MHCKLRLYLELIVWSNPNNQEMGVLTESSNQKPLMKTFILACFNAAEGKALTIANPLTRQTESQQHKIVAYSIPNPPSISLRPSLLLHFYILVRWGYTPLNF